MLTQGVRFPIDLIPPSPFLHSIPPSPLIIISHKLISLDPSWEIFFPQFRRMRPRLEPILLPDRRSEAAAPAITRVVLDHVFDGCFADEGSVEAYVVFFTGRGGGWVSSLCFLLLISQSARKQKIKMK